jgi:hypothetical protein
VGREYINAETERVWDGMGWDEITPTNETGLSNYAGLLCLFAFLADVGPRHPLSHSLSRAVVVALGYPPRMFVSLEERWLRHANAGWIT